MEQAPGSVSVEQVPGFRSNKRKSAADGSSGPSALFHLEYSRRFCSEIVSKLFWHAGKRPGRVILVAVKFQVRTLIRVQTVDCFGTDLSFCFTAECGICSSFYSSCTPNDAVTFPPFLHEGLSGPCIFCDTVTSSSERRTRALRVVIEPFEKSEVWNR